MPQTGGKRIHLERTVRERPEYREILSLFQDLFGYIDGREGETGISFSFPVEHTAERVAGGLPLIAPEGLSVDRDRAKVFLGGILAVMARASRDAEGTAELGRIGRALDDNVLDFARLLAACLKRERKDMEEAAAAISVRPPLLTFVLEILFKTALSLAAESVDPGTVENWKEGYCPVCGSGAGMDELSGDEGKRFLCCSACSFRWPFPRLQCPFCGNRDKETLSYFLAGDEPVRVAVCRKCNRYIKTRDSRKGNADVPLDAEDLTTIHLDLLAGKEGFERGR